MCNNFFNRRFGGFFLFFCLALIVWACKKDSPTVSESNYENHLQNLSQWYGRQLIPTDDSMTFAVMNKPDWSTTKVHERGDTLSFTTLLFSKDKITRELHASYYDGAYKAIVRQYDIGFKDSLVVGTFTINGRLIDLGYFDKDNNYVLTALAGNKNIVLMGTETYWGGEIEEVVVTRPGPTTPYFPPIIPTIPTYNPGTPPPPPSYPPGYGGYGGGGSSSSSAPPTKAKLEEKIKNKPFGLLKDVPCELIQQWVDLGKHLANQAQLDKLKLITGNRNQQGSSVSTPNDFSNQDIGKIQSINDALSTTVNIDYYSVDINKLPNNFSSPEQLLHHIRTNINDFVFSYFAEFQPYKWYGINDYNLWNSSNPLNSIIAINIQGPDNGSVIVTKSDPNKWIFTTIREPIYGSHPVSGNREFGFIKNPNGSYTFYTKGIDRLTNAGGTLSQMASDMLRLGLSPYERTDKLWKSFQFQIENYINKNGGEAVQNTPFAKHPDWEEIKKVIDGKKDISYLNSEC